AALFGQFTVGHTRKRILDAQNGGALSHHEDARRCGRHRTDLSWRKFRQKAIVIPSEAEEPAVQPTGDFTGCLDSARHDEAIFGATYCHVDEECRPRSIIHLDMHCFYAAIEIRDRPSLRGKPVAVVGARDRRGVLTTCNYEARK